MNIWWLPADSDSQSRRREFLVEPAVSNLLMEAEVLPSASMHFVSFCTSHLQGAAVHFCGFAVRCHGGYIYERFLGEVQF